MTFLNQTISLLFITTIAFDSGVNSIQHKNPFDLKSFWQAANDNQIYPSEQQMKMLAKVMPEHTFQPAPPASDRAYWGTLFNSKQGREYYSIALSVIDIQPEVPITDSIYRLANLKGLRPLYKPRYYRTMTRLEQFILAECMENQNRFIPQIEQYIQAIISMKSWLHPNHDNDNNDVLEGRSMAIDLGARRFGSDLALAEVLLAEKISSAIRTEIKENLHSRIIDNFINTCNGMSKTHLNWFLGTSNWNSVCTSGSTFVSMAISKDLSTRIVAVGCALNSIKNYLSGFGEDGYCSEGAGYWNYGFGHYLYLAQILFDYTNGSINLFEADNSEKLKNIGNFPYRYQIHQGICAPFADGGSRVSNDGGFAYKMSTRKYGAIMPPPSDKNKRHDSYSAAFQLIEWDYDQTNPWTDNPDQPISTLPSHTYFNDVGMLISRGHQSTPLSIAIKAGHNAENHNHSDVGTYTLLLGNEMMVGDIGAPSYIAGAFDEDNPARSSWGHPVPIVNNELQSNGKIFAGEITSTVFTEHYDSVSIDLKEAYEVPSLTSLIRTLHNNKFNKGEIIIKDAFTSDEPIAFGVAIMTYSEFKILEDNTIDFINKNNQLRAKITSTNGSIIIKNELVPVKKLREGGPANRIGIDFTEPLQQGEIIVHFTPIN